MIIAILVMLLAVFLLFWVLVKGNIDRLVRAQESGTGESDAVALRVVPNPQYYSPTRWYLENIPEERQGSPTELLVDGYQAVRDGRTVYVSAGNVALAPGGDQGDQKLYVNMYIISHTQDAVSATTDIFGQILNNWNFNTNIITPEVAGDCRQISDNELDPKGKKCFEDYDCRTHPADADGRASGFRKNSGLYCDSSKARITRDIRRLADLREIELALQNLGSNPELTAGTYIANKTISVWPSWQETLGQKLGITLPIDPLNKLTECEDSTGDGTCWHEDEKRFGDVDENNSPVHGVPNNLPGHVYAYVYNPNGTYSMCAVMESGFSLGEDGWTCPGSATDTGLSLALSGNRKPIVRVRENITIPTGDSLDEFVYAYDPDGRIVSWDFTLSAGLSGVDLKTTGLSGYRKLTSGSFNTGGEHLIIITVTDNSGDNESDTKSVNVTVTVMPECDEGSWEFGSWSACSANCGTGTQTRTVTKKEENCIGDGGKPSSVQSCTGSGAQAPDNSNQEGVCEGSKQSCSGGSWVDSYSGINNYEQEETLCDNLDNDCDGQTDENSTQSCERSNSHGTCSGNETCQNGSWVGCDAKTPAEEICGNGIDEDCSGSDEACQPICQLTKKAYSGDLGGLSGFDKICRQELNSDEWRHASFSHLFSSGVSKIGNKEGWASAGCDYPDCMGCSNCAEFTNSLGIGDVGPEIGSGYRYWPQLLAPLPSLQDQRAGTPCTQNLPLWCCNFDNPEPGDCSGEDTISPVLQDFSLTIDGTEYWNNNGLITVTSPSNVMANWEARDFGGSGLSRIGIWMNPISGDDGHSDWKEVGSFSDVDTDLRTGSTTIYPGDKISQFNPGNTYYFGIHIEDVDGNEITERDADLGPIEVEVESACVPDSCNNNCPADCSVDQDPDCGCQNDNNCCGKKSDGTDCVWNLDNDCEECVDKDEDGYDTCELGETGDDGKEADCCDVNTLSGKNTHPGQINYYSIANSCNSFDYNCSSGEDGDRDEERQYTKKALYASATGCVGDRPQGQMGWVSSIPECGQTGRFLYCEHYEKDSCEGRNDAPRTLCGLGYTVNCQIDASCLGTLSFPRFNSWRIIESTTIAQECR